MQPQKEPATLGTLPEELQLHILEALASPEPPSKRKIRDEPTIKLTVSEDLSLKSLSLVSSHWRRLTAPLLFKFARLKLQIEPTQVLPRTDARTDVEAFFRRLRSFTEGGTCSNVAHSLAAGSLWRRYGESGRSTDDCQLIDGFVSRLNCLDHSSDALIDFMTSKNLADKVDSIVVNAYDIVDHRDSDFEQVLHCATNRFWLQLFDALEPRRVVVVAPPATLADLAGSPLINSEHSWAFSSMAYHLIELSYDEVRSAENLSSRHRLHGNSLTDRNILEVRPWTRVHLNEGSYLAAYGTYEYFERGPPTIVSSMCHNMAEAITSSSHSSDTVPSTGHRATTVKIFAYTAIFPFNAIYLSSLLTLVEELDLQLSPDPQTGILDDKLKVGKADLTDCWSELIHTYQTVYDYMIITPVEEIKARRIVVRDYLYPTVARELDAILAPIKSDPGWAYLGDGVFERTWNS